MLSELETAEIVQQRNCRTVDDLIAFGQNFTDPTLNWALEKMRKRAVRIKICSRAELSRLYVIDRGCSKQAADNIGGFVGISPAMKGRVHLLANEDAFRLLLTAVHETLHACRGDGEIGAFYRSVEMVRRLAREDNRFADCLYQAERWIMKEVSQMRERNGGVNVRAEAYKAREIVLNYYRSKTHRGDTLYGRRSGKPLV